MSPTAINIIARTNGVGLDRDVDLLREMLCDHGLTVTTSHCRQISPLRRWLPGEKKYAANIFLERVFPRWLGLANKNFLIPNQERYPERHCKWLNHIDTVLCKSRHAEEVFAPRSNSTSFIGFTSTDMLDEAVPKDYQTFLHLAGRSTLKGTETILDLWQKHPEWPQLTLIQCKENAPESVPDNITLISDHIPHEQIVKHLNSHGIHLCPSLSEGWGHYIVEAMSCRAVVITTDAPPMNELVSPARGIPVPYKHTEPRHLGINFHIDAPKLESNIQKLLLMTTEQKQELGESARNWFLVNDTEAKQSIPQLVAKLTTE